MVSALQMVQCLLGLQLQPPCKSRQTPLHLTAFAQAKWDKLTESKQQGRGRSEEQTRSTPRSAALLHKTDLDQSTLISRRLWALNSATFHSSHKWLRCKVNSIDNYCSAWISRPLLHNLEVTAAEAAPFVQKIFRYSFNKPKFQGWQIPFTSK